MLCKCFGFALVELSSILSLTDYMFYSPWFYDLFQLHTTRAWGRVRIYANNHEHIFLSLLFLLSKNLAFSFNQLTAIHSEKDWKQCLSVRFMLHT